MANSIFYQAGARAALVKLGAIPEEAAAGPAPDTLASYDFGGRVPSFLNKTLAHMGHGAAGGVLGAGLGAALTPKDRFAGGVLGGVGGAFAGVAGKGIANALRERQVDQQNAMLMEAMNQYSANPQDAAASQALDDVIAKRNAAVEHAVKRIHGMGY